MALDLTVDLLKHHLSTGKTDENYDPVNNIDFNNLPGGLKVVTVTDSNGNKTEFFVDAEINTDKLSGSGWLENVSFGPCVTTTGSGGGPQVTIGGTVTVQTGGDVSGGVSVQVKR